MKSFGYTLFLLFIISMFPVALKGQKVILLHYPGKEKHYFYEVGDYISVELGNPSFKLSGIIEHISDSFCMLNNKLPIEFNKVKKIYRERAFFKIFNAGKLGSTAVLYAGFSIINRSINHDKPIIDNTVPIVSGTALAAAFLSYKLKTKALTSPGWKFKVLEL